VLDELRTLYDERQSAKEAIDAKSSRSAFNILADLRRSQQPRLARHDIPVIELEEELTAGALAALLSHRACAVHVRNFCSSASCEAIQLALAEQSLYSNWAINRRADDEGRASEVDKVGVVSGEALDSFSAFCDYLRPPDGRDLEELLPRTVGNPFARLREQLDRCHPEGCQRDRLGRFMLPAGTFRRMRSSMGLVHADTATLLSAQQGEFSANIYVRTGGKGRGDLSIFPARQYVGDGGVFGATSPVLLADLSALQQRQSEGFSEAAQRYIRDALPLKKTLSLRDGDLVLISTGRFHAVEPYGEQQQQAPPSANGEARLSGQCWISYQRGRPLVTWV
jgi:hypothetical protein